MKLSKHAIFFIIIISFTFLIGCSSNKSYIQNSEYGLLYTSNKGSVISLYDNQGKYLDEKIFEVPGITFGSFMKNGIEVKDKIYYAAPLGGQDPQDFVVELDKSELSVNKIKSTGITPTFFSADEKYTFSGISSFHESSVIKTDIEKNKVTSTVELEGQGLIMHEDGNQLYILGINHNDSGKSTSGNLYTIDKSSFKVLNKIVVEDIGFTSDMAKVSNYMYILITNDGLDNETNKVRRVNLQDGSIKEFNLPFKKLSKIHLNNDDIYIVESDFHREEIGNEVAKIDTKTEEIESFNVEGNIISSIIANNKFISSDGEKVYIHNLNDFKLEKEFDAKQYDNDKVFVSIFKK